MASDDKPTLPKKYDSSGSRIPDPLRLGLDSGKPPVQPNARRTEMRFSPGLLFFGGLLFFVIYYAVMLVVMDYDYASKGMSIDISYGSLYLKHLKPSIVTDEQSKTSLHYDSSNTKFVSLRYYDATTRLPGFASNTKQDSSISIGTDGNEGYIRMYVGNLIPKVRYIYGERIEPNSWGPSKTILIPFHDDDYGTLYFFIPEGIDKIKIEGGQTNSYFFTPVLAMIGVFIGLWFVWEIARCLNRATWLTQ